MTITGSGDLIAVATGGVLATPSRPTTPTLTVTAGDGSAVAAITGDSGVTHYLYYKAGSGTAWLAGGNRVGNGNITVTGLSDSVVYIFVVFSQKANGIVSLPSSAVMITLAGESTNQFDELIIATANDLLAEFGEPIVYLPSGGGESRAIIAIVDRQPPADLETMPGVHATRTIISVANNSATGISSSEINLGADKVEVTLRINESAKQKRITGIISQDAGMMKLSVR